MLETFLAHGWCRFPQDPVLARWIAASLTAARAAVADPGNRRWLRCGGTWFAGVNVLDNGPDGAVPGGLPLDGNATDFIRDRLGIGDFAWDRGQVSVCYPGYPQPMPGETPGAFRYRRERDAAHVDGLSAVGPERRRHIKEPHAFVLGVPLVEADPAASPLVVWEGSHEIVREAFRARLAGLDPASWADEDVTEAYHAARREAFASCRRVAVPARPGEAYLMHRLVLHGVAPWGADARATPDGRMIAYFRPIAGGPAEWLERP